MFKSHILEFLEERKWLLTREKSVFLYKIIHIPLQFSAILNTFIVKAKLNYIVTNDWKRFFFRRMIKIADLVVLKWFIKWNERIYIVMACLCCFGDKRRFSCHVGMDKWYDLFAPQVFFYCQAKTDLFRISYHCSFSHCFPLFLM